MRGQPAQRPATARVVELVQAVEEHGEAARLPRFHGVLEVFLQIFHVVTGWQRCSVGLNGVQMPAETVEKVGQAGGRRGCAEKADDDGIGR